MLSGQPKDAAPSQALATTVVATQSDFLDHDGPECYVRPKIKSNRKIIKNAISYVCLAGEVNMSLKQRALDVSTYKNHTHEPCIQATGL